MALETGSRLGHYTVTAKIGEGGMGEVYQARDTTLDRDVALKVLPEAFTADPDRLERFEREVKVLASLNHPHIVTIYSVEESKSLRFFTMELVQGRNLAEVLEEGPLPLDAFFDHAVAIAEALSAAHHRGITHRDLKPANVMVNDDGWIKVLDFGLAKSNPGVRGTDGDEVSTQTLTEAGSILGTVPYMSPEQLQGRPLEPSSDVFSLGVVLYEMATGERPFRGESQADVISSILRDTPRSPTDLVAELPPGLEPVLERCLEKDSRRRYPSGAELREALAKLGRNHESGVSDSVRVSAANPAAKTYRTPLVGREAEAAQLHEALERAASGRGSLVTLAGEPGVGKTRLAWDLMDRARSDGFLTLVGHCYEGEGARPFSPWVEILDSSARISPKGTFRELLGDGAPEVARLLPSLRRVYPDLVAPLEMPPEESRNYLFDCFREFVERSSRLHPLLLVLEDLHWADPSTLLLLQRLTRRLGEMAVLIVGTYRDVELDVARPLAEALRELVRERLVERVALGRLGTDDIAEMLEALGGHQPPESLVEAIHGETEGNPFFVEEVYEHLAEEGRLFDDEGEWREDLTLDKLDVPEGVRLVVGRRLERLDEDGRRILTAAAMLGRRFAYPLLEAVVEVEAEVLLDRIEAAEQLHLIEAERSSSARMVRYRFSHELIRQTLLQGLSMPRRQRLHLRVAESIESLYRSELEEHAEALAHHLYQAGAAADEAKTIRFLELAGDKALEAGGFDEALVHFRDALSIQEEEGSGGELAELRYKKGLALRSLGRIEEAVEAWRRTLDGFEQLQDVDGIARTTFAITDLMSWLNPRQGRVVARRGLDLVGDREPVARARMLGLLARFSGLAGDPYPEAHGPLIEAETLASGLDRPKLEAELLAARTRVHWSYMQFPEAIDTGLRALVMLEERGELYEVAEVGWQVFCAAFLSNRYRIAHRVREETEPTATRVGHMGARFLASAMAIRQHLVQTGELAESIDRVSRDLEWAEQHAPLWRGYDHSTRGGAHFFAGDWSAARADYDAADRLEPAGFLVGHHRTIALVARAYAGEDVLGRLREERVIALALKEDNPLGPWELLVNVVEGLAVLGCQNEAADLYPSVKRGIDKGRGGSWHFRLWQMVAGIAAAGGEHWDAAQGHFETALQEAHDLPHVVGQPEVRRWYARMLLDRDAAGDRDKARTLLGEAADMYRTIGMPKHLEMVEASLDQEGLL